jgi:hypothetical protein
MGLDISAYSKIERVEDNYEATIYIRRDVPEMDQAQDIEEGIFTDSNDCESHQFRAGSYSGYGVFRNLLCEIMHGVPSKELWLKPNVFEGKEFYNLINFSDCEGFFGPTVSKKLHADFVKHRDKFIKGVKDKEPYEGYYTQVYDDFLLGFEIAAKGGVLIFN